MRPAKLSRLQRQILELALGNAQAGNPTSLRQVVGMALGVVDLPDPLVGQRGRVFHKSHAGYNTAMASSSRAVRRLEQRRMVYRNGLERGCSLFCLTKLGLEVAQGLTVSVSVPETAKGKKSKRPRKPKILTKEPPAFLSKRSSRADLDAAKDADWRPVE